MSGSAPSGCAELEKGFATRASIWLPSGLAGVMESMVHSTSK